MLKEIESARPECCPYCGSKEITYIEVWKSVSEGDSNNSVELYEYQCEGCNFSFWV